MKKLPRLACMIVLGSLVAGCGTVGQPQVKLVTQTVTVPVPVRCTPTLDAEPAYPDTDEALSIAGIFTGVQLLKEARKLRQAYIGELQAALKTCEG